MMTPLPADVADAAAVMQDSGFIYRPDIAAQRAERLREALPAWADVFYAVKANAFAPVLQALSGVVDGFEVASEGEAESVATLGTPAPALVASGPGKTTSHLRRLLELGAHAINVESLLELRRVAHVAAEMDACAAVTLRVNPKRTRVTDGIVVGRANTAFGIDEQQLPLAIAAARAEPHVDLRGFHFHLVCNVLDAAAYAEFVAWCLRWSENAAREHGVDLRLIDVGGGLGATGPAQRELDLDALAASLAGLRPAAGVRLILEPGRWMVDDCGFYVAEVIDLKHTRGTWFAVLRGGIHHFFRPAAYGTPHEFTVVPREQWPYPFERPEARDVAINVAGELCTPADVLARDVHVERVRPGDVIVFPRAGSYGWEMSLQEFLGHPRATRMAVAARESAADAAARSRAIVT